MPKSPLDQKRKALADQQEKTRRTTKQPLGGAVFLEGKKSRSVGLGRVFSVFRRGGDRWKAVQKVGDSINSRDTSFLRGIASFEEGYELVGGRD